MFQSYRLFSNNTFATHIYKNHILGFGFIFKEKCKIIIVMFDIIGKGITLEIIMVNFFLIINNLSEQMVSEWKILVFYDILKKINVIFEI